jgi:hypothetical protein
MPSNSLAELGTDAATGTITTSGFVHIVFFILLRTPIHHAKRKLGPVSSSATSSRGNGKRPALAKLSRSVVRVCIGLLTRQ